MEYLCCFAAFLHMDSFGDAPDARTADEQSADD
jgi:hypothetical protein